MSVHISVALAYCMLGQRANEPLSMQAVPLVFSAWFGPIVTLVAFQKWKAFGNLSNAHVERVIVKNF